MRCGPTQQHVLQLQAIAENLGMNTCLCRKFGYALWANAADLVMRYGPLPEIKLCNKICDDFSTVGHSAGFGYVLWTIVQDLIMR